MVPVLAFLLAAAPRSGRCRRTSSSHPPSSVPLTPQERPMTDAESEALPQGEGRDDVAFMCVPCHGVLVAIARERHRLPGTRPCRTCA